MEATFPGEASALPAPAIGACYAYAWRQLWRHFWPLLGVGLIYLLLQVPDFVLGMMRELLSSDFVTGLVGAELALLLVAAALVLAVFSFAYEALVTWPAMYGVFYAFLRAARGQSPGLGDLFAPFSRRYLATVLSWLLAWVITVAALMGPAILLLVLIGLGALVGEATFWVLVGLMSVFLVLIIVAIAAFISVRLGFMAYLVIDESLGPVAALKESWRRTGRYFWTLLGSLLLSIPILFGGLLLLLVGVIPALMWVGLTHATLFASITAERAGASQSQP